MKIILPLSIVLFLIAGLIIIKYLSVHAVLEQRMAESEKKKQWEFKMHRSPITNAIPTVVRANEFRFIKNWVQSQFKWFADWRLGIAGMAQNTRLAYENIWHASGDDFQKILSGAVEK